MTLRGGAIPFRVLRPVRLADLCYEHGERPATREVESRSRPSAWLVQRPRHQPPEVRVPLHSVAVILKVCPQRTRRSLQSTETTAMQRSAL